MSLRRRKTLADELNEIRSRVNKLETGTELRDDSITLNTIRSVKERYNLLDTSGLSLYLGLNGSVRDGSINKRHAILNGTTTFVSGKVGSALSFPGGNITDYIDVPNTALNGFVNFTVSFWIKTTDASSNYIVSVAESNGSNNEFLMGIIAATSIEVILQETSDTFAGLPTLNDGVYHHIVFKRTGTEGAIFIDGVNKTTQVVDATALTVAVGGLIIGQEQDTVGGSFDPAQAFNGDMDEVRFYNRALSDIEILELFVNPKPQPHQFEPEHGLRAFYSFDGHSEDLSGFGYNLPRLGTPVYVDGQKAKAADLDGVNDAFQLGSMDLLSGATGLTLAGWTFGESGGLADGYGFLWITNNRIIFDFRGSGFYITDSASTASGYLAYDTKPSFDTWHFLTATWDGTTMKIYVDAVKQSTEKSFSGTGKLIEGNAALRVGHRVNAVREWFKGQIDEVRFYNRALSPSEILALFNNIRPSLRDFTMEEEEAVASGSSSGACTAFYIGSNPGGANDCDLIIGNQWQF